MKFKRIEISAFRIYDDPRDATFDFTMKDGTVADFISLYAPNGFGKTSFYDAIEWGITGNIQRFWQNEAVVEKSITSQKEVTDQVKLWRHTNSQNKTYVTIEGDTGEPKTRELKFDGRFTIDAKNDTIENAKFRKVILSQEWISAFLKELDGERRYKIFMENSDLRGINNYYKGLKELFNFCNDSISSLNIEAEQKRAQIVEITEENLLDSVNSTILLLQNMGERLELLKIDMSKEEVMNLRNLVSEKILANQAASLISKLSYLEIARIGSETLCGIDKFYEIPESLEQSVNQSREFEDILAKFKEIDSLQVEQQSNTTQRKELQGKLDVIDKLVKIFTEYVRIAKSIEEKNKGISEKQGILNTAQQELDTQRRLEVSTSTEVDSLYKNISVIEQQIKRIPDLKILIEGAEKQRNESQTKIDQYKIESSMLEGKMLASIELSARLNRYLKLVHEDQISNISNKEFPDINTLLEKQKETLSKIIDLEGRCDNIEKEVTRTEELNSTIHEFIKKGLEIVTNTESSICPLCTQTYSSYIELSQKIANNSAISETIQGMLIQKSGLSVQLTDLRTEVMEIRNQIANYFKRLLENETATQKTHSESQVEVQTNIQKATELLRQANEKIENARQELEGETPQIRMTNLNNLLLADQDQLKEKRSWLVELKSKIGNLSDRLTTVSGTIELMSFEVSKLENDPTYTSFLEQYNSEFPTQIVDENVIIKRRTELILQIQTLAERFVTIEKQLQTLRPNVAAYDKETLINNHSALKDLTENLKLTARRYASYLKENLSVETEAMKREDLLYLLKERETSTRTLLDKQQQIKQHYERLDKYSENLQPYLTSESHKARIRSIDAEIQFLTDIMRPRLVTERDKTREFLVKRVSEFFYTKLINSLYNKIDPHPDFRSVEFRVNFDNENPKLDIYVINGASEELLIPNLYFSTAQINILSLSIFLATALNSDDYNCIFIDDPIQSLDSINVLSTIDLIRSIVINQKRQVVLSTHDENFHRLLEKKMPSGLFKSKFIELETFGKVKK